jgi:magnesium chelatase family protein
VKGVLSIALEAKRRGRQTLIVPHENAAEAAVVEGVDVYGASSLSEVVHFLRGDVSLVPVRSINGWPATETAEQDLDFGEVKGQRIQTCRRATPRAAQHSHHGPIPALSGAGDDIVNDGITTPRRPTARISAVPTVSLQQWPYHSDRPGSAAVR